jgi:hypothetical protein
VLRNDNNAHAASNIIVYFHIDMERSPHSIGSRPLKFFIDGRSCPVPMVFGWTMQTAMDYRPHCFHRAKPQRVTRAMHFDLIQTISLSGKSGVPNDDRIGSGERHAWVIDGATDLGEPGLLGERGGAAWLSTVANAAFTRASGSVSTICDAVFDEVAARYAQERRREPLGDWELPIAAFAAVAVEGDGLACAFAGDCAVIHRSAGGVSFLTPIPDAAPERARAVALGPLTGADGARVPDVVAGLRASRQGPKRVLGTDPLHCRSVTEFSRASVKKGDDLLLMTDGFGALIDDYGVYDAAGLFARIMEAGLAELAVELRHIENQDAECRRFPRFKISDDASAIWLRVA